MNRELAAIEGLKGEMGSVLNALNDLRHDIHQAVRHIYWKEDQVAGELAALQAAQADLNAKIDQLVGLVAALPASDAADLAALTTSVQADAAKVSGAIDKLSPPPPPPPVAA